MNDGSEVNAAADKGEKKSEDAEKKGTDILLTPDVRDEGSFGQHAQLLPKDLMTMHMELIGASAQEKGTWPKGHLHSFSTIFL